MDKIPYPYRIHFPVDDRQREKLSELLKRGEREAVFGRMTDMLIDLLEPMDEECRDVAVRAIINGLLYFGIEEDIDEHTTSNEDRATNKT